MGEGPIADAAEDALMGILSQGNVAEPKIRFVWRNVGKATTSKGIVDAAQEAAVGDITSTDHVPRRMIRFVSSVGRSDAVREATTSEEISVDAAHAAVRDRRC